MDQDVRELFGEGRNIAHVATLMPDGSPHCVAVWTAVEAGRIIFFSRPTSQKARNVARDARVALSVADRDNPYRTARVRGRVVETLQGARALEVIDRVSRRYTGEAFPLRISHLFAVEPDRAGAVELPFADPPGPASA
jgi:PPOX class probable F420-dependent enzyme